MDTIESSDKYVEMLESIGETDDTVVKLPTDEYKAFSEPLGNTKDKLEGLTVYLKTSIEGFDYSGFARVKHTFGEDSDLISLFFSSCTLEIEGKYFGNETVTRFINKKIAAIRVFDGKKFKKIKDGEPVITDIRVLPPAGQWKNDDKE